MSINIRKPDRQAALAGIMQCKHFVEGEEAVKLQKQTYLNPFYPNMDPEAFKLYLKEAQIGGVTGAMHSSVTGALLRRPPTIELPTGSEWILDKFGDRGQGLLLWMAETLDAHVVTSNDWVFIDFPAVAPGLSKAQEEALNIYPYPVRISAESILDTSSTMYGSYEKLTEMRYEVNEYSKEIKADERLYTVQKRVVKLFIGADGLAYRQDYIDGLPKGGTVQFLIGGKAIDFLPVFSLNGRVSPIVPLLLAMSNLDYHLYNKKSRRNHYNYVMNTSTLVTSGVPTTQANELTAIGGRWDLGDDKAKAYSIGVDPNVITSSKIIIDEDLNNAAAFGARMFADDTREAESAEALAIKNASSHATIGHLSTVFSAVMIDIIKFVIMWQEGGVEPADGSVRIELSKDFVPAVLNGNDLTALVNASVQNKIPNEVLYAALVKGELIPDGMSYKEFQSALDEQAFQEPVAPEGDGGGFGQ